MHNCDELQNRIWDAVETGELSPDLLDDMGDCQDCARELALARSAMDGFGVLRCVDAPEVSYCPAAQRAAPWGWVRAALAVAAVLIAVVVAWNVERKPDVSRSVIIVKRQARAEPEKEVKHTPPPVQKERPPAAERRFASKGWTAEREPGVQRQHGRVESPRKLVHVAKENEQPVKAGVCAPCVQSPIRPVQYRVDESREAEVVVVQEEGSCFVKTAPYVRGTRRIEPAEHRDDQSAWRVRI